MNLNGVTGDARKKMEEAEASKHVEFDRHPECLICGRRDYHTHVGLEDCTRRLFGAPRD